MKKWQTVVLVIVFLVGLSLLLYPPFSNYWNSLRQSRLVYSYMQDVSKLESAQKKELFQAADAYNQKLAQAPIHFNLSAQEQEEYEATLDVSGTGVMGYLEIPKIGVSLPIYHGTEEVVLEFAIGHLAGTSVPVGGESTHSVLTGHTGLPSAKLLTDMDEMELGDIFYVQIMDETLTYEVDQIKKVLPENTQYLSIIDGEDHCTLITCTPYGINTHRLLVRGRRIETARGAMMRFSADALLIDPLVVMPILAVPILLILFLLVMAKPNRSKKREKQLKALQDAL
jgi:sortase A